MFLTRAQDAHGRAIVEITLSPADAERLVAGECRSFALRDAGLEGPDADQRVLVAYFRPHERELLRNGYLPGLTDARVLVWIDHPAMQQLRAGQQLNIQTPGSPVARFIVTVAEREREPQRRAAIAPEIVPDALAAPLTADQLEAVTAASV